MERESGARIIDGMKKIMLQRKIITTTHSTSNLFRDFLYWYVSILLSRQKMLLDYLFLLQ